jgi:hypothetical protein
MRTNSVTNTKNKLNKIIRSRSGNDVCREDDYAHLLKVGSLNNVTENNIYIDMGKSSKVTAAIVNLYNCISKNETHYMYVCASCGNGEVMGNCNVPTTNTLAPMPIWHRSDVSCRECGCQHYSLLSPYQLDHHSLRILKGDFRRRINEPVYKPLKVTSVLWTNIKEKIKETF